MKKYTKFLVIITILWLVSVLSAGCTNSDNKGTTATKSTNVTETVSSGTTSATKTAATDNDSKITKDKAEDIALKDAGFTIENATVKTVKKDIEDGKEVFEIEFVAKNYEYDYVIDASTGNVVYSTRESDDDSAVSGNETKAGGNSDITMDEAKQIALKHASVSESTVKFTKTELDTDDGVKIYEIDFRAGNMEYEYDINAKTGKIISSEKDAEKSTTAVNSANNGQTSTLIPSSKAVSIALVDAGVKEKDAKVEPVDLDAENGVQYYDVKFRAGNVEYEYEINAKTGEVISADKD